MTQIIENVKKNIGACSIVALFCLIGSSFKTDPPAHPNIIFLLADDLGWAGCTFAQVSVKHNLTFDKLPTSWDEALPLGNGFMGELIW